MKYLLLFILLRLPTFAHALTLDVDLSMLSGVVDSQSQKFELNSSILNTTLRYRYEKIDDKTKENNVLLRSGYDPRLTDLWSLWSFAQLGYDKIREIDFESYIGGGLKYYLLEDFSISLGYLQHHQKFESDSSDTNRISLRLKGQWEFNKILKLSTIIFYQPDLEFEDRIFSSEASLKYKINEVFSTKLLLIDQYRSASRVDENNELSIILAFSFKIGD